MLVTRERCALGAPTALRAPRGGFTLVELLLVVVLLGIIAGGMMGVIVKQQRFYTGSVGVMETRASVREGIQILQSDLRGISPRNGDIYAMTPTSIEFRLVTGASVVCTIGPTRTVITVPPTNLANDNGLTSWVTPPQMGDSIFVYDTSTTHTPRWQPLQLADTVQGGATCPQKPTGFTSTAAEASSGYTLVLSDTLRQSIPVGAGIRGFRHVKYELYQASDGNWYLGYYECGLNGCGRPLPVSGPYLPASAGGNDGLDFAYYDSTGAVTSTPANVRRIDITMRAKSTHFVNTPGRTQGYYTDSLQASVAVRN
jgi:prepilin-type N-terminal cleavage/methylation domain-containing protein